MRLLTKNSLGNLSLQIPFLKSFCFIRTDDEFFKSEFFLFEISQKIEFAKLQLPSFWHTSFLPSDPQLSELH
jgi:hypothetical protein